MGSDSKYQGAGRAVEAIIRLRCSAEWNGGSSSVAADPIAVQISPSGEITWPRGEAAEQLEAALDAEKKAHANTLGELRKASEALAKTKKDLDAEKKAHAKTRGNLKTADATAGREKNRANQLAKDLAKSGTDRIVPKPRILPAPIKSTLLAVPVSGLPALGLDLDFYVVIDRNGAPSSPKLVDGKKKKGKKVDDKWVPVAKSALMAARFKPARFTPKGGQDQPCKTEVTVTISFDRVKKWQRTKKPVLNVERKQ